MDMSRTVYKISHDCQRLKDSGKVTTITWADLGAANANRALLYPLVAPQTLN